MVLLPYSCSKLNGHYERSKCNFFGASAGKIVLKISPYSLFAIFQFEAFAPNHCFKLTGALYTTHGKRETRGDRM